MNVPDETSDPAPSPPNDRLLHLYRVMQSIRRFEEVACELLAAGKIPGGLHTSVGQEAVAAGVCETLSATDLITTTHRGHGHCIAKGAELEPMMAELMGKATGTNGGRAGSMHIADPACGILGANGIVGGGLPIAVGAAYACQVRNARQVVACFFGDGAANEGTAHEAMNLASVWQLPIVFVCENNQYAEMTPQSVHARLRDLSRRAAAYDVPGESVDGNDVLAVFRAAALAVTRAREGGGPTLLECRTYRMHGHYEGDPQRYKPPEEAAVWAERDPLRTFTASLVERGVTEGELRTIREEVERRLERAVAFGEAGPAPDAGELLRHVYTSGD